jgi:hypothetical protein
VFQRLFLATDAPIGQTWLLSTRIPLTELALHCQALASKVPLVAKARDAYSHFCTAIQMNKVPGRYWKPKPDPSTSIQQHYKLLDPQPVPTPMACLISLSSEAVGDILYDKTLHSRGCRTILGHSRHGGCKPPIRVIPIGFLGQYGALTVWSPSRLQPTLPPHGGSGKRISQSQTPWYHGFHAGYSAPFLPL